MLSERCLQYCILMKRSKSTYSSQRTGLARKSSFVLLRLLVATGGHVWREPKGYREIRPFGLKG
jgi:hypothetical protein